MKTQDVEEQIVSTNRKALHDYFIIEKIEAGIALKGTEVKSLRLGDANLQDSYATIKNAELWLLGLHISPFEKGNINNHDPRRERKLLLHKKEILRLFGKISQKGFTLIPLNIYFKKNRAKITLALATGKKLYDKREAIAKREIEREMQRHFKQ
jgi:SsrA-binding protein